MNGDVMTTQEVMDYLRISRSTLYRMVREARLPVYRIGARAVRYRRQDVEKLLQRSKEN